MLMTYKHRKQEIIFTDWWDEAGPEVEVSVCRKHYSENTNLYKKDASVIENARTGECDVKGCKCKAYKEITLPSENCIFEGVIDLTPEAADAVGAYYSELVSPLFKFINKGFEETEISVSVAECNGQICSFEPLEKDSEAYKICLVLLCNWWGVCLDQELVDGEEGKNLLHKYAY